MTKSISQALRQRLATDDAQNKCPKHIHDAAERYQVLGIQPVELNCRGNGPNKIAGFKCFDVHLSEILFCIMAIPVHREAEKNKQTGRISNHLVTKNSHCCALYRRKQLFRPPFLLRLVYAVMMGPLLACQTRIINTRNSPSKNR